MVAITVCPSPHAPRSARPAHTPGRAGVHDTRLHVAPSPRPTGVGAGRAVGVGVLVLVMVVAVGYLMTAPALDTSGAIPVQDTVHVVAPGETMWSIADAVAPAGEAATYVERLVEVNGTAAPAPGQVLELPVP